MVYITLTSPYAHFNCLEIDLSIKRQLLIIPNYMSSLFDAFRQAMILNERVHSWP